MERVSEKAAAGRKAVTVRGLYAPSLSQPSEITHDDLLPLALSAGEIRGRASRSNADITHEGEGRWPWDIDQCPACGGSIEIEKED